MERETKEFAIDARIFKVKAYATAREAQAIRQANFVGSKVEVVGDQPKMSEFNPGARFEVEKELVTQMVVSLDGTTENLLDRCLDLPSGTFDALVSQLDDLVAKKKDIESAIGHYSMGKADSQMLMVAICQEFGWTYEEYQNQPNFFITLIKEKMIRDNKERELEFKKAKRG